MSVLQPFGLNQPHLRRELPPRYPHKALSTTDGMLLPFIDQFTQALLIVAHVSNGRRSPLLCFRQVRDHAKRKDEFTSPVLDG